MVNTQNNLMNIKQDNEDIKYWWIELNRFLFRL